MGMWSLPQLAAKWGLSRKTTYWYVKTGLLVAWQSAPNCPWYVTDTERLRFERHVQPTLRPGRKPAA